MATLIRWLIAIVVLVATAARAQDYPAREIRSVCNFAPGSGADIIVRYYSDKLAKLAGKPVIVENKPGMISSAGADAVAKSPPDGYTILINPVTSSHAANVFNFKKLPYDPIKDFTPVATLQKSYFMLMVRAAAPWTTVTTPSCSSPRATTSARAPPSTRSRSPRRCSVDGSEVFEHPRRRAREQRAQRVE